jgi:hypothetical protein
VALFLDFMQYVFTLIETDIAVKAAWKATKAAEAGYDEGNIFRRLSTSCFVAKLLATGLAALWVLAIMLSALSASTKPAGNQPASVARVSAAHPGALRAKRDQSRLFWCAQRCS